jgi:hypothetical protein
MACVSLERAIAKLAMAGEKAGFTIEQMIEMLNSGLTVETLVDLISWRLRPESRMASLARASGCIV